jgi:hypothetical protein
MEMESCVNTSEVSIKLKGMVVEIEVELREKNVTENAK